jgi:hypothetical protein
MKAFGRMCLHEEGGGGGIVVLVLLAAGAGAAAAAAAAAAAGVAGRGGGEVPVVLHVPEVRARTRALHRGCLSALVCL